MTDLKLVGSSLANPLVSCLHDKASYARGSVGIGLQMPFWKGSCRTRPLS